MNKALVKRWVGKVGELEATARLIRRGIKSRTVEQIVGGTYDRTLRQVNQIILSEEMASDGFVESKVS